MDKMSKITSIKQLVDLYTSIYYLEDTSIIPLVCAVALSNKLPGDPIWLMIVGGSSSGKSEIVNAITALPFVHEISMLTPNTLLSGMKAKGGKETSLLLRIPRSSVIVMKDFTTILSMNKEDQQAIMGQFREMYDGKMSKDTGTGDTLKWEGKITLLAGVTEKIHAVSAKFDGMGTRAINYTMVPQDRMKTARRSVVIAKGIKQHREDIRQAFKEYIEYILPIIVDKEYTVDEVTSQKILNVSDFAALARSPVERDFQGKMALVLSPEMPMRMSNQLHLFASVFMAMEDGKLLPEYERIIYKVAIDCIPKGRRMVAERLAQFDKVTTKALAMDLNYETDRIGMWLGELNVLGICKRDSGRGPRGDIWEMNEPFRTIMLEYGQLNREVGILETAEEESNAEISRRVDEEWDSEF